MNERMKLLSMVASTGPLCRCGARRAYRWGRRGDRRSVMRCANGHYWRSPMREKWSGDE